MSTASRAAHLLVIDGQNDFCDIPNGLLPLVHGEDGSVLHREQPALAVPGAHADMIRLAAFIDAAGSLLSRITATLDSHPVVAIERTTFWLDAQGNEVPPFTVVTCASVTQGRYRPRHGDMIEPVSGEPLSEFVVELLDKLERVGKTLMVWPVHCVTGTWGHNIHSALADRLCKWEILTGQVVDKVFKGEYPLTEHYGVFEAETPVLEIASTLFNSNLARKLDVRANPLFIGGEASSHCVPASYFQYLRHREGDGSGIYLLSDCMSPVPGFERDAADFFERAKSAGSQIVTTNEALAVLRAI
ncbi:cysteine hydrolase [Paucibacter soli]|uniref:cysteine hydrolase n=1 Tax=Paucibacter soli TaxID=3133433 RepID=UPI0030949C2E